MSIKNIEKKNTVKEFQYEYTQYGSERRSFAKVKIETNIQTTEVNIRDL